MKRKIFKIAGIVLLIVVVAVTGFLGYIKFVLPDVGAAPDLKIEATAERVARGKYLVENVAGCIDCHSARDWNQFAGPIMPGTEGQGGEIFDQRMGLPGSYISRNITPFNLGNWTDGEILRAITMGVDKFGHALFPIMPYPNYGRADREDVYSIIAYIRTLKPVKKEHPASSSDFPMNFIINTIPQPAAFHPRPPKSDTLQYGKYLVMMADCAECHTQHEKGNPVPGMEFAGGMRFPMPLGGVAVSANITPDKETGIGTWKKEDFIRRFKQYSDSGFTAPIATKGSFNTIMPWRVFSGMTEEDLGAIYTYLHSLKPVHYTVNHFVPE